MLRASADQTEARYLDKGTWQRRIRKCQQMHFTQGLEGHEARLGFILRVMGSHWEVLNRTIA